MKMYSTTVGSLTMSFFLTLTAPLHALTVGDITVLSHRGEPFRARVPVDLSQRDLERGVQVALGNEVEYGAEGLSRSALIDRLDVSLATSPQDAVHIVSTEAVEASSLDIVLLVRSGLVTIVRSYRVAVPPAASSTQAATRKQKAPQPAPGRSGSPSPAPASAPQPPPEPDARLHSSWLHNLPAEYGPIQPGATLTAVVQQLGAPPAVKWQTVVRLWEANKSRFMGENMHGVRVGTVLRIPPDLPQTLASLRPQGAQRIVVEQWEAWQGLRQATGGQQTVTSAGAETDTVTIQPIAAASDGTEQPIVEEFLPEQNEAGQTAEAVSGQEETPPQHATVVLPAEQEAPAPADTDVRALLQGLEQLLARRQPQAEEPRKVGFFVRSSDLQAAIEGLEERLTQRLQNSLGHITIAPQTPQRVSGLTDEAPTFFDRWVPENSMMLVLLIENALLLLLAGIFLVRWSRRRTS